MKSFKMYTGNDSEEDGSVNANKPAAVASAFFGLLMLGGFGWYFFGGGFEQQTAQGMKTITQQVASDFVQRYEIAKRNGDPTDICLQAELVAAGYLQAHDEANYDQWKQTEKADCAKAGIQQ